MKGSYFFAKQGKKRKIMIKTYNLVLFTMNASYSHTSLSLRCLYDAISKYKFCNGLDSVSDNIRVNAKIIEKNISDKSDRVLYKLYAEKADFYCFSSYIWNAGELIRIAQNLKKLLPHSKMIFGGPEISNEDDRYINNLDFIDYVIRGDGENALPRLINSLINKEVISKIIDGMYYDNFVTDGIHYDTHPPHNGSMVYYESSRGCPYTCAYCLSGCESRKITAKSVETTLDELLMFEKFNELKIVKLVDRTFNYDIKRANDIWHGLNSNRFTKTYHFEICAELLDENSFKILSEFPKGKLQFEIGIQSTNPDTLSFIRRRNSLEKIINNTKRLHSLGNLSIHADLIAGLPKESYQRFAESFDDVFGLCDVLQVGFLKLLKGSYLRKVADSFGCKYTESSPYAVLCTDCITYSELMTLHEISDLVDRYYNSGRFEKTMSYMTENVTSYFSFFENLNYFIKQEMSSCELRKIPQRKAYELLYNFMCTYSNFNHSYLFETISSDFCNNEVGRLPYGISKKHIGQ